MVAEDYENRKDLINPYITLNNVDKDGSVSLNTETFRDCQEHIIDIVEFEKMLVSSKVKNPSKFYRVSAVIGAYDFPLVGNRKIPFVRVSLLRRKRSRNLLGYLEESVVKENLPKTFNYFN